MSHSWKPTNILLGTLIGATSVTIEASIEEYKWGKAVCNQTSSKVVRNPFDGTTQILLYAPMSSCRCEKDPANAGKVELRIDMNRSTVTIFTTDKSGKKLLWNQFHNCAVLNSSDWDCSFTAQGLKQVARMISNQALFIATDNDETTLTIKGQENWGSCIRRYGWSLKELIGK